MNIRSAIKAALLPVCLETTVRNRKRWEEQFTATLDPVVDRVKIAKKIIEKSGNLNKEYIQAMLTAAIVIAHGRDKLKLIRLDDAEPGIILDPLTVVTVGVSKYSYTIEGRPYILMSGKKRCVLDDGGHVCNWSFNDGDLKVATDLQVEECLDSLNEKQVRAIFQDEGVFAPLLSSLLSNEQETQPSTPTEQAESNDQ